MKYFLITIFLFFIYSFSHSQSPTYKALLALSHNVDNNQYDLNFAKPSTTENSFFTNVFFKYYKNPNIQNVGPDESFIFSIGYQYLISSKITQHSRSEFSFPLYSKKDKKRRVNIATIDPSTGKETKVKSKFFDTKVDENVFNLIIMKNSLPLRSILKIFVEIESFNFNELILTPQIKTDSDKRVCSINIPQVFSYQIQTDGRLEKTSESEESMQLKELTYSTTPIVDYYVNSYSTKWVLDSNDSLKFILEGIDLPVDLGTSIEQIMKYSNK